MAKVKSSPTGQLTKIVNAYQTGPPGAYPGMKGGIPMRTCDACGKPIDSGSVIGGSTVCRSCEPDVKAEIDRLQAAGEPVSAIAVARSMFRETHANYMLRDIPKDLWIATKHKAIDKGLNLRELILDAIREYVSK